jgi:rod shape-determining protein MreD
MDYLRLLSRSVLLTIPVFLVHVFVVPYLSILHIRPDVLLILIVYFAIREGQVPATIAGFAIGALLDLTGGEASVIGLTALTKSIGGFLAGYFHHETRIDQTLGSSRFLVAVAISSIAHNLIFFVIYLQGTDIGMGGAIAFHAIPSAAYTVMVALLPMFRFSRKPGL